MEKWHKHFGVYGLAIRNSKQLVVKKTAGPYLGRYDLPGGTLNAPESIIHHLEREYLEETGYNVRIKYFLGVQDFRIDESYLDSKYIHHIGLFYYVEPLEVSSEIMETVNVHGLQEKNDSSGIYWADIDELADSTASPLVMHAITMIRDDFQNVNQPTEMIAYDNWTRITE